MPYYFVTPEQEPDLQLNIEDFLKALDTQGENLSIETAAEDKKVVSWTIRLKTEFPLEGAIYGNGQAVMMDGQGEDLLAFAVWLRSYIPAEHTLLLWDGSGSSSAPLTSQATLEDITAALDGNG